jgi:hypothetical protein
MSVPRHFGIPVNDESYYGRTVIQLLEYPVPTGRRNRAIAPYPIPALSALSPNARPYVRRLIPRYADRQGSHQDLRLGQSRANPQEQRATIVLRIDWHSGLNRALLW